MYLKLKKSHKKTVAIKKDILPQIPSHLKKISKRFEREERPSGFNVRNLEFLFCYISGRC